MSIFKTIDDLIILTLRRISIPLARLGLFIVYFWFGILKLFNASPANPLVENLLHRTLPFLGFHSFIIFFGIYEMLIGACFLIPNWERIAIALLVPHMITTFMPLVLLPGLTWQGFFAPTLEGQYIIKNLIIVGLAFSIASHLHPWSEKYIHEAA